MLIQGKIRWAKIVGEPSWGYKNAHKEWSCDLFVDDATIAKLKAEGLKDRLKDKGDGTFITFKRRELKADGTPNKPIRIVDSKGQPWDGRKIGNGSVVNVNFAINEFSKTEKNVNILSLQVWELVPYEGGGDFPIREDDESDWAKEVA